MFNEFDSHASENDAKFASFLLLNDQRLNDFAKDLIETIFICPSISLNDDEVDIFDIGQQNDTYVHTSYYSFSLNNFPHTAEVKIHLCKSVDGNIVPAKISLGVSLKQYPDNFTNIDVYIFSNQDIYNYDHFTSKMQSQFDQQADLQRIFIMPISPRIQHNESNEIRSEELKSVWPRAYSDIEEIPYINKINEHRQNRRLRNKGTVNWFGKDYVIFI